MPPSTPRRVRRDEQEEGCRGDAAATSPREREREEMAEAHAGCRPKQMQMLFSCGRTVSAGEGAQVSAITAGQGRGQGRGADAGMDSGAGLASPKGSPEEPD